MGSPFQLTGIHHVTAMASDPQANINFYEGVLGLRLVKVTINYDDPSMVHLYYANGNAEVGSTLTFFPIPGMRQGVSGRGAARSLTYSVPTGTVPAWQDYLASEGVATLLNEAGEVVLRDPDGMEVRLRPSAEAPDLYSGGRRPLELAPQRIVGVELHSFKPAETQRFLTGLGATEDLVLADGAQVSLVPASNQTSLNPGAGTFHHVAFTSSQSIEDTHAAIIETGRHISPIMERDYFRSIYFREPGAVLFEVATLEPGFTFDEPLEALGTSVRIPDWLTLGRESVKNSLPELHHFDGNMILLG
ncbi:MAG: VOC family protein [Chthonomonas sp.]|nr:VOC family protein [Chthonomonas sp.]